MSGCLHSALPASLRARIPSVQGQFASASSVSTSRLSGQQALRPSNRAPQAQSTAPSFSPPNNRHVVGKQRSNLENEFVMQRRCPASEVNKAELDGMTILDQFVSPAEAAKTVPVGGRRRPI